MYPCLPPNTLCIPQHDMRGSHFLNNTKALTNISEGMFLLRTKLKSANGTCNVSLN